MSLFGGVRWEPRRQRLAVDFGASRPFSFARVNTRARVGAGRSILALAANGSVTASGLQPPRTRTIASTGTAGVHGRVFYDHDGDGIFGPGDEPAADVVVLAGPVATRTRDDGTFSTFGVAPWERMAVRLDTLRIPDPAWSPAQPQLLVRPTPNMSVRVDFPLVATREVLGVIRGGEGIATVGGIRVTLTRATDGAEFTTLTFSDGEYYFSRLPPGRYTLTLSEAALAALQARVEPADIEVVVPPGAGPPVRAPEVRLQSMR
jgi:hypothetical protein